MGWNHQQPVMTTATSWKPLEKNSCHQSCTLVALLEVSTSLQASFIRLVDLYGFMINQPYSGFVIYCTSQKTRATGHVSPWFSGDVFRLIHLVQVKWVWWWRWIPFCNRLITWSRRKSAVDFTACSQKNRISNFRKIVGNSPDMMDLKKNMMWKLTSCVVNPTNSQGVGAQLPKLDQISMMWFVWLVVSNILYVHPYLGKIPILTDIFSDGLKPPTRLPLGLHSKAMFFFLDKNTLPRSLWPGQQRFQYFGSTNTRCTDWNLGIWIDG